MSENKDYLQKIYDIIAWQAHHVKQLAFSRNLILILSTASLGYTITLLINVNVSDCEQIVGLKMAIGGFLASLASGIIIALLESENYRLKYKISRNIERDRDFKNLQRSCTKIESINRVLFYMQLILFFLAITVLSIVLI